MTVTEALKTSNIKTVLFILRTIDKEGRKLSTSDDATYILMPETLVPKTRDISALARTVTQIGSLDASTSVVIM
jgi:hypothetical protein